MLILCFVLLYVGIAGLLVTSIAHSREVKRHNRRSDEFLGAVASFFSDKDEQGLTAYDKTVHVLAESVGKSSAMTTVAAMRGTVGGAVKSAEAALEETAIEHFPQAAVLNALPKRIQKNPVAQMGLAYLLEGLSKSQPGVISQPPGNNHQGGSNRSLTT